MRLGEIHSSCLVLYPYCPSVDEQDMDHICSSTIIYSKSPKNVALAWFKNNNEIIHFDPTSGLLLEDKDSNKRTFNNSSARFSDLR